MHHTNVKKRVRFPHESPKQNNPNFSPIGDGFGFLFYPEFQENRPLDTHVILNIIVCRLLRCLLTNQKAALEDLQILFLLLNYF